MRLGGFFESADSGRIWRGFRVEAAGGWRILFALVLCCWGNRAGAALSTITETVSVAPALADFSEVPVSFQKFDTSLGKLSSVEIILQATGEMTQKYENTSKNPASLKFHQGLELLLTLPDGRPPLVDARQKEKNIYQTGAFDGVVDFGGTSGGVSTYDLTSEDQKTLTAKNRLAEFTGSGLVDLFLSTGTSFNGTHFSGNAVREAEALAGADITIIYNYVAAPEPEEFGAVAGMLGVVVLSARVWRARKTFGGCGQ